MPKYRQLHLKILDSIDFNEMPNDFTRLTWVFLPLIVDSSGRGPDNPAWVRSKMYPLREDVELSQINTVMAWFEKRKMIIRYTAGGNKYFYIPTWNLYQTGTDKEAKSSIPSPEIFNSESKPTPELLPTSSGHTPDLLPVNQPTNAINNAINNGGTERDPSISFYTDITGISPDVGNWQTIKDKIEAGQKAQALPIDELKKVCVQLYDRWKSSKTRDGKPYNPSGLGWLDWIASGYMPPTKKEPVFAEEY